MLLHGRRNAQGGLALAGVLIAGLLVSGVPLAPAATDTSRCGGATNEVDPVTGEPVDPAVVIVGVNTPTEGDDIIFGTNGADTINGRGGNDIICGFDGNDTINGGTGNDQVFAGLGDDKVHGDDGDDELNGEAGTDSLSGDTGNDRLFGLNSSGSGGSDSSNTVDGGTGNDEVYGSSSADTLTGAGGDDALFGGDGADTLDGGDGNDNLTAEAGNDKLLGQTGDDALFGGAGNDDLQGGDGLDQLNGSAGDDNIVAGAGEDHAFGGDGNDVIEGNDGPDELNGENGNDTLRGDDGDDTLFGGPGSDTLDGGNGIDQIFGGTDVDLVDYSAITAGPVTVDLATNEVKGSAGADTIQGVEAITGTSFDDDLTGDANQNIINGGAGDDTIDGGLGNDVENGDDGNDTFSQSGEVPNGADTINGGAGAGDTVDYTSRGNRVSVTLDGIANDGEANEGDNVGSDVEGSNLRPTIAPIQATAPDLSAPTLSNFRTSGSRFSPNGDGRLDEFTVSGRFSESTTWTFEVLSGSSAVFTDSGDGTSFKASWNGLNADGRNVVSTTFRWRVTGKDAAGNPIAARTGTVTVDRSHPVIRGPRISRGRLSIGARQHSTIRFAVNEAGRVTVKIRRGSFLRTFGPTKLDEADSVAVTWNGRTRRGKVARPGRYQVEVGVRDLAGNLTVRRSHITVTP
jgi:Ca2+-binding RTX toxin-like protein